MRLRIATGGVAALNLRLMAANPSSSGRLAEITLPEQPLSWLSPEKRERIESPEFYQLLQAHATRKYLALKKSGP